jgi:hypothetical protein
MVPDASCTCESAALDVPHIAAASSSATMELVRDVLPWSWYTPVSPKFSAPRSIGEQRCRAVRKLVSAYAGNAAQNGFTVRTD